MKHQLVSMWDIITSDLANMQVTYARLFSHNEIIYASVYQWELITH